MNILKVSVTVYLLIAFSILISISLFILWLDKFLKQKLNITETNKYLLYGHVSEVHKRIDLSIKLSPFALLLLGFIDEKWFSRFGLFFLIAMVISQLFRAFMEYKHGTVPNLHKLILILTAVATVLFAVVYIVLMRYDVYRW